MLRDNNNCAAVNTSSNARSGSYPTVDPHAWGRMGVMCFAGGALRCVCPYVHLMYIYDVLCVIFILYIHGRLNNSVKSFQDVHARACAKSYHTTSINTAVHARVLVRVLVPSVLELSIIYLGVRALDLGVSPGLCGYLPVAL